MFFKLISKNDIYFSDILFRIIQLNIKSIGDKIKWVELMKSLENQLNLLGQVWINYLKYILLKFKIEWRNDNILLINLSLFTMNLKRKI